MSNDSNNWCPDIYRSVFIDRHNDTHVRIAPCCQADFSLEPVDTFDFSTSPYLNQLRKQFDQGQRPTACDSCWSVEKHGHKSRRQSSIEFFENLNIAQDTTVMLHNIDYNATWACNLACVMCTPQWSSSWAKEEKLDQLQLIKIGRQFQKNNTVLNNLDLQHVKSVHFNGGEPLINHGHLDLLKRLDSLGLLQNVSLSYNTNGTVLPDAKTIDLWSRARLVKLFFSIDAVGSAFEYIRWPADWIKTSDNMLTMKQNLASNTMFGFNVTVGPYNVLEMSDVYNWFDQNLKHNREGDPSDFCWQMCNGFDLKHLPTAIKAQAADQLRNIDALKGIVNYLESVINYSEDSTWTKKFDLLDTRRNTNWKQALRIGKYY